MKRFAGKGWTAGDIAYGGFKDVPRQVALVIRNPRSEAARVRVKATRHDTYHDNGWARCERELGPGGRGLFILAAPARK